MIKHPYYLGFTLTAARQVAPAAVPGNYKQPDVIAKKLEELRHEAARVAPTVPTAGQLVAYCLLDRRGAVVSACAAPPPRPARDLVAALAARWTDGYGVVGEDWDRGDVAVVGFDVHTCLRVACVEALLSNRDDRNAFVVRVPPALYCGGALGGSSRVVDPYALMVATEARKHVGLGEFLMRMGATDGPIPPAAPFAAAEAARQLCALAQLFEIPDGALDADEAPAAG